MIAENILEAWKQIREQYLRGVIVSERDMQARLALVLKSVFPANAEILVEPAWDLGQRKIPDIVIVVNNQITDIFELKYVPHHYAKVRHDLAKLAAFQNVKNAVFPVSIDPQTGCWSWHATISEQCRFHFAVISRHDAVAVSPDSLRDILEMREGSFYHWYGRVGGGEKPDDWSVVRI